MINIAIAGANGRMGQLIMHAVENNPEFKLIAKLTRTSIQLPGKNNGQVDIVLIDFTIPEATLIHLNMALQYGYPMVIGTTGFTEAQKHTLKAAAQKIPIVFSPNMSLGMNVNYKVLALAEKLLKNKADMAILDMHHKHKKDAPSGSALRMAEVMSSDIPITSMRLGENIGSHTAFFSLEGETLEIIHRATDRTAFAKGALQAAKWVLHQAPGLYDMQDVLEFK